MDPLILSLLFIAVFGASLLQAATGIGYGVIAGPIFLVALNGVEAFQISTIHNLLIALILTPMVFQNVNRRIFKSLVLGSIFGVPIGFALQLYVQILVLKIFCIAAVGFVATTLAVEMLRGNKNRVGASPPDNETLAVGGLAGIMGGMLAMPGPVTATWMSIRGIAKQEIRATVLAFFVSAYGFTLLLHVLFSEFETTTIWLSLILSPALVAGIVGGNVASHWLSEQLFKIILLIVLAATVASLLASVSWR